MDAQKPDSGRVPQGKMYVQSLVKAKVLDWLHSSLFSCHPGVSHMQSPAARYFWWPSMCPLAPSASELRAATGFLLQPLAVPGRPWSHIALDFVTDSPRSQRNTVVLTLVDRFSRSVHFIPLPKLPTAFETTQLLYFTFMGSPMTLSQIVDPNSSPKSGKPSAMLWEPPLA